MFGFLGNLFGAKKPKRVTRWNEKRRRWESATTHDHNEHHWATMAAESINTDLQSHLKTLRDRAKTEIARNPILEGIVDTLETAVVGPNGPTLRVLSDSESYNDTFEKLFAEWWTAPAWNRTVHGTQLLRMFVRNLMLCGEYFCKLEYDRKASGISLRLAPVRPDRVATPVGNHFQPDRILGIDFDDHGNPKTFFVDDAAVPADEMIHGFRLLEEDQARGVPWVASVLDTVADIREYDVQVLDAAKAAADHALVMKTNHPDAEYVEVNESIELERRRLTTLPPGYDLGQVVSQQPAAQYIDYRREKLAEIGRPFSMPLMLIRLTAENHNYSSARMDMQLWGAALRSIQADIEHTFLRRVVSLIQREATLRGVLPPLEGVVPHAWTWPVQPHVDPTKEAMAERMLLENGTISWEDAIASHGQDPDILFGKLKRDTERRKEVSLPKFPQEPAATEEPQPETEEENNDAEE